MRMHLRALVLVVILMMMLSFFSSAEESDILVGLWVRNEVWGDTRITSTLELKNGFGETSYYHIEKSKVDTGELIERLTEPLAWGAFEGGFGYGLGEDVQYGFVNELHYQLRGNELHFFRLDDETPKHFAESPAHYKKILTAVFPLPTNEPRNVSTLGYYSSGKPHSSSYITEYVLGDKGSSDPREWMMDLPAPLETEVYAVLDGIVYTFGNSTNGGHYIVLHHEADDSFSYYGHLFKEPTKKKGPVQAGEVIGYVGNTGVRTTGPHLHFSWSNHDPFCEFTASGVELVLTEAAKKYPHVH